MFGFSPVPDPNAATGGGMTPVCRVSIAAVWFLPATAASLRLRKNWKRAPVRKATKTASPMDIPAVSAAVKYLRFGVGVDVATGAGVVVRVLLELELLV